MQLQLLPLLLNIIATIFMRGQLLLLLLMLRLPGTIVNAQGLLLHWEEHRVMLATKQYGTCEIRIHLRAGLKTNLSVVKKGLKRHATCLSKAFKTPLKHLLVFLFAHTAPPQLKAVQRPLKASRRP